MGRYVKLISIKEANSYCLLRAANVCQLLQMNYLIKSPKNLIWHYIFSFFK